MAGVLGCSALLFDGRTLFGLPLRYRWLALPHCLAMLTHLWFAYPHLDYFFGDKTRGAEVPHCPSLQRVGEAVLVFFVCRTSDFFVYNISVCFSFIPTIRFKNAQTHK